MKIIFVDSTIQGPEIGGAQTFLPLLMKGLKNEGHDIHLATKGTPDKKIEKQIAASGVALHTAIWKKNALVEDAAIVFADWVNKLNPDVYIISVSPDTGWLALPYLNSSIATFTIGHTDAETFYLPARHYHNFLTKAIAVSDQISEEYIANCNLFQQQVNCIPYGVKVNPSPPMQEEPDILKLIYVGRIEETQKRISDLAAIAKELAATKINFRLKVIGDGPALDSFHQKLTTEIAENKVILCGWLSNDEVVKELRKSDVFVLTSAYEGFCIALVEAMANGCCPIVTDIESGNKQLVTNEKNGFIVPVGGIDEFIERITFLASNPEKLFQLRQQAWETGKKYSIDAMVENYHECFKEAIQEMKRNPRQPDHDYPIMQTCRSPYPLWLRRLKAFAKGIAS